MGKLPARDTGIVETVAVILPRPGPVGRGRGVVTLRPGTIGVHAGETAADAVAFADALRESWNAHHAAELARPLPKVTRAARVIAQNARDLAERHAAIAAMTPAEREAANAAAYAGVAA